MEKQQEVSGNFMLYRYLQAETERLYKFKYDSRVALRLFEQLDAVWYTMNEKDRARVRGRYFQCQ